MAIITRLDRVLADRKCLLPNWRKGWGFPVVNLSNLKTGKVR